MFVEMIVFIEKIWVEKMKLILEFIEFVFYGSVIEGYAKAWLKLKSGLSYLVIGVFDVLGFIEYYYIKFRGFKFFYVEL